MAGAAQGEGRGLSFAEQQLLRHGWERGKGLGKEENGICEPVKVKVKCDKGGVGHKQSEQFTFHWWDHVFNKASSCLDVETGQEGVVVKKKEGEEEEEGMISNKKPRKAMLNKSALYGCFVKSATLFSGEEQPEGILSASEESSSSDEDDKLDLSCTTKLSDDALMRACGGRTAHKGARHGLKMSAKLARLEQQEQEFLAKYGKKEQTGKTTSNKGDTSNTTEPRAEVDQEPVVNSRLKKPRKKKRQSSDELSENPAQDDPTNIDPPRTHLSEEKSKKQKKCSKEKPSDTPEASVDSEVVNTEKKRKKRKKKQEEELGNGSNMLNENSTESVQQCEEAEETVAAEVDATAANPLVGDDICKKEKRKKKKHSKKTFLFEEGPNESSAVTIKDSKDAEESHGQKLQEEGSVLQPVCDGSPKKKKKKLSKHNGESFSAESESYSLEANSEDLSTKKKKHKKKSNHEK